jgi:hypothetical protein
MRGWGGGGSIASTSASPLQSRVKASYDPQNLFRASRAID